MTTNKSTEVKNNKETTEKEIVKQTVKESNTTKIMTPAKTANLIPIWVPEEDLSTICEPVFRTALRIAWNTKVRKKGKNIEIVSPVGCENFVPEDQEFIMDKKYPGLMPSKLENITSYAANCYFNKKAKINTMRFVENDSLLISTDHLKTCNTSSRPTCFLANYCKYCFPAIARYIRYLTEYFPNELERQRKEYNKNPYPTYRKLERFIFDIDDKDLEKMEVPVKALETGKCLIDMAIILPLIINNDEEKSFFITVHVSDSIKELALANKLTVKNIKQVMNNEFFTEKLDKNFISANIPYNLIISYIKKAFENPVNNMNYLISTVLLSYVLLQSGRYKDFLDKQKKREEEEDKKAETALGKFNIPAKGQYHGILLNESQYVKKDIIRNISRKLQKNNEDMLPTVINMSFIQFLEMFSMQKEIDGYNHSFGLLTENRVIKNVLYVLNEIDEVKYNLMNIKRGNNNEARIYRKGMEFLANPHKDVYILLDCTEEEKEKLYDLDERYFYLYKPWETTIRNMTAQDAFKKFNALGNRIKKEDFLQHFEQNSEQTPFKNDTYLDVIDMYYKSYRKLPAFNPRNGKGRNETFHNALNNITGLQPIKDQLERIYQYINFEKKAKKEGLALPPVNRHMLFKGNPGTGKTTVARIVAKMLFEGNIIKKDKFIECKSSDLIGEYVGETGQKTESVIKKALDGVLFIDEAYALTYEYEYGKDAIATIVKEMEDKKDRLVIILAGYQKEMEHLVNQNPGMKSRIGYTFDFPDYSEEELVNIFNTKLKQIGFLTEKGVAEKIKKLVQTGKSQENFGNGRFIDRIIQETIIEHAQSSTDDNLKIIGENDIPTEEKLFGFKAKTKPTIGFKD